MSNTSGVLRRMRRMQRAHRRLPRLEAHAADILAGASRSASAAPRCRCRPGRGAFVHPTGHVRLHALHRAVDEARRAAAAPAPRPARARAPAHGAVRAWTPRSVISPMRGKAELEMRREPGGIEAVAGLAELVQHVGEILRDVSAAAGSRRGCGCPSAPGAARTGSARTPRRRAHQQHAGPAMRACGGISNARNSTRPSRPVAVSGAYSLSMQNSVRCVLPVMSASRWRNIRSTSQGATCRPGAICENAISSSAQAVLARLVDPRMLAGRADEQAAEQVGQARMVVPEAEQRLQQIGPAQERAVGRLGGAHHHVVAAAGADMAAVDHELLACQADLARLLVELLATLHDLASSSSRDAR